MIKLYSSVCIEVPAAKVWAHLAKLEDIQLWSDAVLRARCEGDVTHGVGAERVCDLPGNLTIREHWTAWEEGHAYTYEGFGLPMMNRAVNRWTVISQGDKTLLTSEARLDLKGGVFAVILEFIMAPMVRRAASNALAPFKYFVEHGRPYSGKSSELAIAPVAC